MEFREITRKKQALSLQECIKILSEEKRGVLAVQGDGGYPYAAPLNHWYNPEDGALYFHTGKKGHRNDAISRCDKASFCVMDKGFVRDGEWALNIKSVIVFGRIEAVEDPESAIEITRKLSYKFTKDNDYIENEIAKFASKVFVFRLVPEQITGKLVNES